MQKVLLPSKVVGDEMERLLSEDVPFEHKLSLNNEDEIDPTKTRLNGTDLPESEENHGGRNDQTMKSHLTHYH